MVTIEITSAELNKFQRQVDKHSKETKDAIDRAVLRSANKVKNAAQGQAPRASSGLASSYRIVRSATGMQAEVYSDKTYAPYVEFGTGTGVRSYRFFNKIQGLREYAMQFKGRGVRQVNRTPVAHLFKALYRETPKFLNRINKILNG